MGKHDIGGTAFRMSQGTSRQVIAITCSKCGELTAGSDKPSAPLDVVIRHFATRGFLITERGRKAVCPKCQSARAERQSVDESEVMARLDRQREAEERRVAETSVSVASTAPRTLDAILVELDVHVERIPTRHGRKDWRSAPRETADVVRLYLEALGVDQKNTYHTIVNRHPVLRSSITYFAAGLVTDGSRPWGDLRVALTDMGVRWTDHVRRKLSTAEDQPEQPAAAPTTAMTESENAIMQPTTPAEPTREARRAAARMYALLDQHFNVADGSDRGTYSDGWSDDRVAQDSGLAVAEVSRTREDVYGKLADDPRLAEVEAKVEALRAQAERDLGDLAKMAAAIREQLDASLADLRRQVEAVRRPKVAG